MPKSLLSSAGALIQSSTFSIAWNQCGTSRGSHSHFIFTRDVTGVDQRLSEPMPEVEPDQNGVVSAPIIEDDGVESNVRGAKVKLVKGGFLVKSYKIATTAGRGAATGTHIIGSSKLRACTLSLM